MNKKLYLAMAVSGILLGVVYHRYGTHDTPPGQPGLVTLERTDFQKIFQQFDGAADKTRILVLLSPTATGCLEGAAALGETLQKFPKLEARVFVVWERATDRDRTAPATPVLGRINDVRAAQFWDPERFVSRALGEKDEESIVWDWVAVYPPGVLWGGEPLFRGRPVLKVKDKLAAVLAELGS